MEGMIVLVAVATSKAKNSAAWLTARFRIPRAIRHAHANITGWQPDLAAILRYSRSSPSALLDLCGAMETGFHSQIEAQASESALLPSVLYPKRELGHMASHTLVRVHTTSLRGASHS